MSWFYVILVWLHLLAATFWVGGMLFLSLVAVPLLRANPEDSGALETFVGTAKRFRSLAWGAITVLVLTGLMLLPGHVSFTDPFWEWPAIVLTKLLVVALALGASITHEFFFGPKVSSIKQKPPSSWSSSDQTLVTISPWLSKLVLVFGLAIFLLAVVLSRY